VSQLADRFLILADARAVHGLHRADDGLQIPGAADFSAQTRRGVAHAFSTGSGLGWKGANDFRAIRIIAWRSSSLNFPALPTRPLPPAGIPAAASRKACSASVIPSSGTRSKSPAVNASSTAI